MPSILQSFLDSILGKKQDNTDKKRQVKPAVAVPATPVNDADAEFFKSFLLDIYQCTKPFDLAVVHTKPKTRMGTYAPRFSRIRINDG